ncbi:MAG: hypothetical protein IJ190_11835 [Prevotella sp.]|nr:hypothetical protein [Prevotella sp.]
MSSRTNLLQTILTSPRTVFNVQSLMLMTGSDDSLRLTKSLHYHVADGKILNPRRGIYTKLNYNEQEMACSLFRPSYISLEYVLGRTGVIFQWDDTISSVSYLSRQIEIDGRQYLFRKINPELWIGMEGIEQRDNVAMASAERAFLDMVYLSAGNCYFDNIHPLSIKNIRELLPLYRSPILNERVAKLMNIKL